MSSYQVLSRDLTTMLQPVWQHLTPKPPELLRNFYGLPAPSVVDGINQRVTNRNIWEFTPGRNHTSVHIVIEDLQTIVTLSNMWEVFICIQQHWLRGVLMIP